MTEGQRDYLADLAGRKGVRLENTDNVSQAWASKKIDELKGLPDGEFNTQTDSDTTAINKKIANILMEMGQWNFQV